MKKAIVVFSLLGVISLLMVACGGGDAEDLLEEIQDRGTIRVSTDANYEPQSFLNAAGDFVGFDIDAATEIAKRLDVDIEFVTPSWDIITAGNWADQWDLSVGSMTVTPARQKVLLFADPAYYYTPAQFAAADGSGIDSYADLDGQTICVGQATTYESWLNGDLEGLGLPDESLYAEAPTGISVIPLETDSNCVESIQAGREEFLAFLTSNTVIQRAIEESGVAIHRVGSAVFSENLAASADRNSTLDSTSLIDRVGEIVAEMHEDGTLSQMSLKWFGYDITLDPTEG
jgi:polar amino acid transport system substrate-binding protein